MSSVQNPDVIATGNSSDYDTEMQSNKPLFLNFTAELAPVSSSNNNYGSTSSSATIIASDNNGTAPAPALKPHKRKGNVYKVSGVNILNR